MTLYCKKRNWGVHLPKNIGVKVGERVRRRGGGEGKPPT